MVAVIDRWSLLGDGRIIMISDFKCITPEG